MEKDIENQMINSIGFQNSEVKEVVESELTVDSNLATFFDSKIGKKIKYKNLYWGNFTIKFTGGGTIALKPSEMIIFDDGTFKSTTNYSSKMYTKYKRPRYTSKMYLTFHLKKDGTILDTFVMRWYVSCGDGRYVVSGNYDPKYFDLINGGSIEYGGTAYNC